MEKQEIEVSSLVRQEDVSPILSDSALEAGVEAFFEWESLGGLEGSSCRTLVRQVVAAVLGAGNQGRSAKR